MRDKEQKVLCERHKKFMSNFDSNFGLSGNTVRKVVCNCSCNGVIFLPFVHFFLHAQHKQLNKMRFSAKRSRTTIHIFCFYHYLIYYQKITVKDFFRKKLSLSQKSVGKFMTAPLEKFLLLRRGWRVMP